MKPDGRKVFKDRNTTVNRDDKNETREKKPFDKKTYRLKKYSNKYKVEQWEDRRKKSVLRDFYKELQKNERNAPAKPVPSPENSEANEESKGESKPKRKPNAFFAAKLEFQKKEEEKRKRKEEILKAKSEREEALKKYKDKKAQNYKRLSKKTKKGQPVMKDRLEMLLEKIQETS